MKWLTLTDEEKKLVLRQANTLSGIDQKALEKDWWVTLVLRAIFQTPYAMHLLFKGGTSLSKSWKLIDRFSEDIDLSIDRAFHGFDEELSTSQIKKLKRISSAFVSNEFKTAFETELAKLGIPPGMVTITAKPIPELMKDTVDPQELLVEYPSLLDPVEYLPNTIRIEISARSLKEPFSIREIDSLIDEYIPGQDFGGRPFPVRAIDPEITMLEKIFLMHEEFTKAPEDTRSLRMSRHLYDLVKLLNSEYAAKAIFDQALYDKIITHRQHFINQRGIDYSKHSRQTIDFRVPERVIDKYLNDYQTMRERMIYRPAPSFKELLDGISELHRQVSAAFNRDIFW